ncbi:hypothetical protein LZD49_07565 [Dyadobacter sp. CY261]|uniref:hypothetical protein n=1 Tax=Dyadobacter sp. CY261 TaxID=2907203 RepID=UPI001F299983|nr:hypothetical protein [Dyadobacter sp. CY261]MCF0070325.1 hypothetical protein [Dyadobacter sp. CY261]
MDIRHELLADPYQSKWKATKVAEYACTSPEAFKGLMHCFESDEYRLAQRAAYSASIATRERPELIKPYIGVLISQLKRTDVHDAVVRNSARILQDISIPAEFHGELMDAAFVLVGNRQLAIAIRAFCLTILFNLSEIYPEIKKELRVFIEESIEFEQPAFVSRAKKILKKI